ncbi:MAG: RNA methyltransferase [Rhodobacteraceae bacterium]|nr:RNA methyltransferase [Paracoccaceae bacterium]
MSAPGTVPDPVFVLVRPQLPENIGAAARGMLNFGLDRMRLVAPRDGWPSPKAVAMASGAGRVLDAAGHFDTLAEAVADCHVVYATTARPREMTKTVLDPAAAMAEARAHAAAGLRVAVVFGPERAGLENADLVHATAIVTVPVNPAFPSINLAQCALLVAYEWHRQGPARPVADFPVPAERAAVERLAAHWEERLEAAGFFFPPDKAEGMRLALRNLWSRMPLTAADVQTLHGVLRQLVRRAG